MLKPARVAEHRGGREAQSERETERERKREGGGPRGHPSGPRVHRTHAWIPNDSQWRAHMYVWIYTCTVCMHMCVCVRCSLKIETFPSSFQFYVCVLNICSFLEIYMDTMIRTNVSKEK